MTADATPAARRRVRLSPDRRREQIVTEATRLIAQTGFNAVSLADIADACGIRKPSVLHYFPTMNDLLRGVLAHRDVEAEADRVPADKVDGPEEVRVYLRRVVEKNVATRELVRLFVVLRTEAFDPDHPAHDYFDQRAALALSEVESLLRWKPSPTVAALQLLSFWQGLESIWVNDPSVDFLAVWDAFWDDFLP